MENLESITQTQQILETPHKPLIHEKANDHLINDGVIITGIYLISITALSSYYIYQIGRQIIRDIFYRHKS